MSSTPIGKVGFFLGLVVEIIDSNDLKTEMTIRLLNNWNGLWLI
jgi:hypothetical protein